MNTLYNGCWHKLDRAKKHADELKADVLAWPARYGKPPYRFRKEFKRDLNGFSYTIASIAKMPTGWSLIIGDALTNFRASLDYLAHDLVGRGTKPHLRGTSTPQFVICRNGGDFTGQANGRLPGIRAMHRAIIETYQPYWWGAVRDLHPLLMLDELVRRDKHREIQPVFSQHSHHLYAQVVKADHFIVTHMEPGGSLGGRAVLPLRFEPNAEVLRVLGQQTGPNPDVVVRFQVSFSIAFESGAWVPNALDDIGTMIAQLFSAIEPTL
jgi:hypothetical protein